MTCASLGAGGAAIALQLRPAVDTDVALIYGTWLNGYRYANRTARRSDYHAYFSHQRSVIDRLMLRDDTHFTCAVEPSRPEKIYGWICYTKADDLPVIHYVYVQKWYRQIGIARTLAKAAGLVDEAVYTHITTAGRAIVERKLRASKFVPAEEFLR